MMGFGGGSRAILSVESARRVCALLAMLTIGALLTACQTQAPPPPPPAPVIAKPAPQKPVTTPNRQSRYFRLPNTPPGSTPLRVGMLLPFSDSSADTRAVADALEKSAELALFDSGNRDIILIPRDEGRSPQQAATAAQALIDAGAEIILGPLFANSVSAVAPIAARAGIPVIAFSNDRSVAGGGVYLLSFQPETQVERVVSYAVKAGRTNFGALVPQGAYGDKVAAAFRETVDLEGGTVTDLESFVTQPDQATAPARAVANSRPDAILIGTGGTMLSAIAPVLAVTGKGRQVQLLGTGLWDDSGVLKEPMVQGGWFAAPDPALWRRYSARYSATFGDTPARIATLGYDAMSLVAVLAKGTPFSRFSAEALTDPNGFSGVDGIFRFRNDGACERGLSVLQVSYDGLNIVDPAPKTFLDTGF
jgi:ABC-type branched-subunit amino acid transport system substrate-binding protein